MKYKNICVIGLGYVGLQVAYYFSKKYNCLGFDTNSKRISNLIKGNDVNNEIKKKSLLSSGINYTNKIEKIKNFDYYIVTVPTPIFDNNKPDLKSIKSASKIVGKAIKKTSIVIYESTVYPGLTEEICIPILEKNSKLKNRKDFNVAYSPERINPNDKKRNFSNIEKIVSSNDKKTLNKVYNLYSSVIKSKVHKYNQIKVAEAAKIIENTQRDLNIALINELSIIFSKMGINTYDVLQAAKTKWNFNFFSPGLVGGHCIGVDPYYLTYKSKKIGYNPSLILSGRNINDNMSKFVFEELKKNINFKNKLTIKLFGVTFKENCTDIRNSKIFDLIDYLDTNNNNIEIYDPLANKEEVFEIYNKKLSAYERVYHKKADIVIISSCHDLFFNTKKYNFKKMIKQSGVFFDFKGNFYRKYNLDKSLKFTCRTL